MIREKAQAADPRGRKYRGATANDDGIAGAELLEHALKLGSLAAGAGDLLAKDLPAASFFEGVHL
jgi:hypothetical protein